MKRIEKNDLMKLGADEEVLNGYMYTDFMTIFQDGDMYILRAAGDPEKHFTANELLTWLRDFGYFCDEVDENA